MNNNKKIYEQYLLLVFSVTILLCFNNRFFSQELDKNDFTLGISSEVLEGVNERDAKATLKIWGQLFSKAIPSVNSMDIKIYNDINSIINDSKQSKIDILYISALRFELNKVEINLEPFLKTQSNFKDFYNLSILSNNNKKINSFLDLKGSTILIQGGKFKEISEFWLDYLALQNGIKDKKLFFKKIEIVEKPLQAVLPIIMNKADYCIINSASLETLAELNPQVSKNVTEIFKSPDLVNEIICVNQNLSDNDKEIIKTVGANFEALPRTDQLFKIFKSFGASKFNKNDMKGIQSLIKEFQNILALKK